MKKIILITPGQPSINPRIVKEAEALTDAGHDVTILYCFWINWAQEADKEILATAKWKYQQVGGTPNNTIFYYLTKVQFKIANILNKYVGNKWGIAERAQLRCYSALLSSAKNIKADWYIAHNLGALAIAVKAAIHNNTSAGFDFEDYHRGEYISLMSTAAQRGIYLENKYVPSLAYVSAASPLISEQVKKDFLLLNKSITTLNNTFPKKYQPAFIEKDITENTLQLFWFSQTVGTDRGLEVVIDALQQLNDKDIYLTLIGKCAEDIKESFLKRAGGMSGNLKFKGVVAPADIISIGTKMDIGLALEQAVPYNRDICLTNKIFTYLQCGNALVLTKTAAQTKFQQEYQVGIICNEKDTNEFSAAIKEYKNNRNLLNSQKKKNWQLANEILNWENESKKLLALIQ